MHMELLFKLCSPETWEPVNLEINRKPDLWPETFQEHP